jgi:radical SAM superfamily enzyme YgiQ (UPF0313 family)
MQLAALLKRAGHEARLACARTTPLAPLMESYRPHLVGYTACTGLHRYLLALNRGLKRRWDFISVFGGPHPTFFPEMLEEPGVDVICRGEGDGAILDIAGALDAGRPLAGIANLWVKTPDGGVRAPVRPLVSDLDRLPLPDRQARYDADPASRDYPVKSFMVSRGCPFRCSYCFNSGYAELYGPDWCRPRVRSVASVVGEIEAVRRTARLEFVQFRESVFPWQDAWLVEFAEEYPCRVGLPFYCHVRADLVDGRHAELLASAGCASVNLGIECGDERYRREVLGRSMSDDCIETACRELKSRGIRILADNMLGLPGAPPEADWKTLELNRRCGVDYPLAMIFQPYPGTELGRRAVEEGSFDGDFERIDYNYYLRSPLRFPDEAARRQVENLQKLFALLVEAPWLKPLARLLLRMRPNLAFLSVFRSWYLYCYRRRIVRCRLASGELRELARSLFGIFHEEVNRELSEENPGLAGHGGDGDAGTGRRGLHPWLRPDTRAVEARTGAATETAGRQAR